MFRQLKPSSALGEHVGEGSSGCCWCWKPPSKKRGGGGIENIDFMFLYHKLFSNHSSPETVRFKWSQLRELENKSTSLMMLLGKWKDLTLLDLLLLYRSVIPVIFKNKHSIGRIEESHRGREDTWWECLPRQHWKQNWLQTTKKVWMFTQNDNWSWWEVHLNSHKVFLWMIQNSTILSHSTFIQFKGGWIAMELKVLILEVAGVNLGV